MSWDTTQDQVLMLEYGYRMKTVGKLETKMYTFLGSVQKVSK